MSYQVALGFEDGVTRFITCGPSETVADASYKARINIPLDCRDGACGTCKSLCESGDFDGGDYIDDALTEAEAAAGYCLPCQMVPRSDLVVQIPTTSDVAKTTAATHPATVTAVTRLAEGAFALSVELDDRRALAFLPGQYVNVSVPGTDQVRSYSFSTGPDDDRLSFLIKYAPGGAMSEYLAQRCAVGDRLELTGPMGSFFLRESPRPLLLLAGGTGLAPVLSILESLAVADSGDRPVHLVYGTSRDADVVYTDLLDDYVTRLPGLTWDLIVSDPATAYPNTGYVTGLIRPEHVHNGEADVYLCGPPPMVESVRTFLDSEKLEVTHFYYEKFTPATGVPGGAAAPAPVEPGQDGSVADGSDRGEVPALETPAPAVAPPPVPSPAPETPVIAPVASRDDDDDDDDDDDSIPSHVAARGEIATTVGGIAARPLGYRPPAPGLHHAPAAASGEAAAKQAAIAARPVGFEPRVPRGPGADTSPASSAQETTAPIAARPVGYIPPPVTVRPTTTTTAGGTTSSTLSLSGGERSETITASTGVVSGEVHPGIANSDAQFDARMALELGSIELTMGRLDAARLAEFRMLAESANQYIEGDHFLDPERFTAANAQFHEYLFRCTGNDALLQAYRMLEVTQVMNSVLPDARWVSEEIVPEHLEIVAAFENSDRDAARYLIRRHTEHAKATMRAALAAKAADTAGAAS
ncbi:benzoate 1,2-dioxygenase electron transfer component BenC [Rhodococcus sp. IEGM 1408]|uniref:benzoate 1,2-dioxygenase electron transfer component BenC n=1 Tax=Rhodococcus sp. IEGM 1408 TaxID=3082220 RepID=UPI002952E118|nr:benzoate 1,2-dioxygenase electron transfer component BenC [Rhodococcus sp. IEGM 1408]MDV8000724.1 benzoate 1,2-dioxygenase electron transfer component BenC [Rhodococcus sp. IEGM 1408]